MNNTITIQIPQGIEESDFYEHIAIAAGYQKKVKKMEGGQVKVIDNPMPQEEFAKEALLATLIQTYRQGYKIKKAQEASIDADVELDEKLGKTK